MRHNSTRPVTNPSAKNISRKWHTSKPRVTTPYPEKMSQEHVAHLKTCTAKPSPEKLSSQDSGTVRPPPVPPSPRHQPRRRAGARRGRHLRGLPPPEPLRAARPCGRGGRRQQRERGRRRRVRDPVIGRLHAQVLCFVARGGLVETTACWCGVVWCGVGVERGRGWRCLCGVCGGMGGLATCVRACLGYAGSTQFSVFVICAGVGFAICFYHTIPFFACRATLDLPFPSPGPSSPTPPCSSPACRVVRPIFLTHGGVLQAAVDLPPRAEPVRGVPIATLNRHDRGDRG